MAVEGQDVEGVPVVGHGEVRTAFRPSEERPIHKLSVRLIDTYKHINRVYYEARAKKTKEVNDANRRGGAYNDGYDDQQYDYILLNEEVFADRYILKHRIGKGSFGQVVCAYDQQTSTEVAIKIIKSRRPFMVQAQTEIALLEHVDSADPGGDYNAVKMINKFVFRNHQCLVFEMLSYNLYELLKNTKFKGVSLNLIRKFSRQILKSLSFLARPEVDIIHCDLKPENILLRHPRRSSIKLIDFGSSCYANKRMYTYIQSRFYRSPEVLLGLSYDQKIDVWSLGCVLVEMHTGEPLFGGSDQCDQMCRIVDILGMPPVKMIEGAPDDNRNNYFEKLPIATRGARAPPAGAGTGPTHSKSGNDASLMGIVDPLFDITLGPNVPQWCDLSCVRQSSDGKSVWALKRQVKEGGSAQPAKRSLAEVIGVHTGGPHGRHEGNEGHTVDKYNQFLSFIQGLLRYSPRERTSAAEGMEHEYILDNPVVAGAPVLAVGSGASMAKQSATVVVGLSSGGGGSGAQPMALDPADPNAAGAADGDSRGRGQVEWRPRVRSRSAPSSNSKQAAERNKGNPTIATTHSATVRQDHPSDQGDGTSSPSKAAKTGQNLFGGGHYSLRAAADANAANAASGSSALQQDAAAAACDGNVSVRSHGTTDGDDSGTQVDDATTTESKM